MLLVQWLIQFHLQKLATKAYIAFVGSSLDEKSIYKQRAIVASALYLQIRCIGAIKKLNLSTHFRRLNSKNTFRTS